MPTEGNTARDQQHRLTDMAVEEVSFVDRGANKKRFLIVKREGGPMAGELVPDGRGGMKRVKKSDAGAGGETEEEKAAKAKKPPFGGNKAPPFKPKPKDGEEEEEGDDTEKAGDGGGDEEETDEEKAAKAAKAKDGNEEESDEIFEDKKKAGMTKADVRKGVLASVTQAIELLMDAAEDLKDGGSDEDEEGDYEPPAAVTANAKKAVGLLAKVLGAETMKTMFGKALGIVAGAASGVTKAGRRMSKERLDRFTKALADLQNILKEVMAAPELKDDAEKRGGALLKALAKVAKSALSGGGGSEQVGQLIEAITELTELGKGQEQKIGKLERQIETLRKGGGASNALGVDTRERPEVTDGVEWPFDLNRPIDKAHTDDETSFYDEEN